MISCEQGIGFGETFGAIWTAIAAFAKEELERGEMGHRDVFDRLDAVIVDGVSESIADGAIVRFAGQGDGERVLGRIYDAKAF